MAEFQNKANDLHSYIREIESKEKNYRKFKVLAAILTLVLTLGILTWVWIIPPSLNQLFNSSFFSPSQIAYSEFHRENLNFQEAQKALNLGKNFLLIFSQDKAEIDTIYTQDELFEYVRIHNLDTTLMADNALSSVGQTAFTKVENMPYFPGGKVALAQYLQSKLVYPSEARASQVEGNVQVRFVILPDGTIDDVKIIDGIGYGCDEEALRLVSEMPKWVPGTHQGETVAVFKALAIKFQLL